ncbi:DUF1674 domain-containing protein [Dokdonella sp.]|uniref:DUF1674 domain-containing protein n=1 Tax=Dokdonella sp. TaxID=2291710 RepID=UPI002F3FDBB7
MYDVAATRTAHRPQGCLDGRLGLTFAPHCIMPDTRPSPTDATTPTAASPAVEAPVVPSREEPVEIGGRESGLDPTRYGDWEKNGRCIDF